MLLNTCGDGQRVRLFGVIVLYSEYSPVRSERRFVTVTALAQFHAFHARAHTHVHR